MCPKVPPFPHAAGPAPAAADGVPDVPPAAEPAPAAVAEVPPPAAEPASAIEEVIKV